jgi:lipoprotein-releasing system permease protein
MSFPWFIARRYLTARRRQAFISVISAVSILGVGVGVMALIIALALMTGVGELRDRRSVHGAHLRLQSRRVDDVAAEVRRCVSPASSVAPAGRHGPAIDVFEGRLREGIEPHRV